MEGNANAVKPRRRYDSRRRREAALRTRERILEAARRHAGTARVFSFGLTTS